MNKLKKIFVVVTVLITSLFTMPPIQAAEDDVFVVNDSASFVISGRNKLRTADTIIVYDPSFGASTNNNQWGYEIVVENDVVTKIFKQGEVETVAGAGANIPSNGFVISAHGTKIDTALKAIAIGDTIKLNPGPEPITYPMAFTVNGGAQNEINKMNTTRSADSLVLFTYVYGAKTGTNPWGLEVIVDKDNTVIGKRAKGSGDDTGSEIPKYGYVLSAHGTKEALLTTIQVGDKIELLGVSVIELDKSVTFKYIAVNPNATNNPAGMETPTKPFPGFRGGNQLVIYDTGYPEATTGTNDYGYEVIVSGTLDAGTIASVGGNNSPITAGNYVLSGHGDAASFLINNAKIGASVHVDSSKKEVTIQVTPKSLLDNTQIQFTNAKAKYDSAKADLYNVDSIAAETAMNQANDALQQAETLRLAIADGDTSAKYQFLDTLEMACVAILEIEYAATSTRAIEGRGVWHRPKEKNLDEVKATLQELKDSGFNILYLETFFNGHVIFPTDSTITSQNPLFADKEYGIYGNDLLKAFSEEAKAVGIEIHTWVHDFYVGYQGYGSVILDAKPEWELLNYDGQRETKYEGGVYYFMDPSNPEVQAFLLDLYTHIVQTYDIDGLQLDYIRYPVGKPKEDWGYNDSSVQRFIEANQLDQDLDIRQFIDESSENYALWNTWKQNNVTNFVKDVSTNLKAIQSDLILSTAIFANIEEAKSTKMQDWPLWVESGYLDVTAPMAYYKDTKTVETSVAKMVQYVNGNAFNYAGLAPTFIGMSAEYNLYQILAARAAQAQGHALFASQNVLGKDDVQNTLKKSVHRQPAISANHDSKTLIDTQRTFIATNFDQIYIAQGKATQAQKETFLAAYDKSANFDSNAYDYTLVNINNLETLRSQLSGYGDSKVQERLAEDLVYLLNLLKTNYKKETKLDITFDYSLNDYYFQNREHTLAVTIRSEKVAKSFALASSEPMLLTISTVDADLDIAKMEVLNPGMKLENGLLQVEGETLQLVFKTKANTATITLNGEVITLQSVLYDENVYSAVISRVTQASESDYDKATWLLIQTSSKILNDFVESAKHENGDALYGLIELMNVRVEVLNKLLENKIKPIDPKPQPKPNVDPKPENPVAPATNDTSQTTTYIFLLLCAVGAIAILKRKQLNNK